jgi:hypothetical protein
VSLETEIWDSIEARYASEHSTAEHVRQREA